MISVANGKASFQPKTQIVDGEDGQIDEFYFPPEAEKPYVSSTDSDSSYSDAVSGENAEGGTP